jgi:hypothetical protein
VYQDKQVEFKRGTKMNSGTKRKSKFICVLFYVLRHEDVSGYVVILSYILNLEARCENWSTLGSGRLNFWEIAIGKLRGVGWSPEPV